MNRYKFIDEKGEHLHTLDGRPLVGTSTALGVMAKPLTYWAAGLALEKFGWSPINDKKTKKKFPREQRLLLAKPKFEEVKGLDLEKYLDLLDEGYYAHTKKLKDTATQGTDMHAQLEDYVKHAISSGDFEYAGDFEPVKIFSEWAKGRVKRFLWSELHSYSEKHWLGGISDCGFEDVEGKYAILDFKSSKEAYLSQFFQNAGYDIQLTENGGGFDKDGNKIFELDKPISYYAVLPFGMENPQVQTYHDVAGGKEAFLAAVTLYKKTNI